MLYVYIGLMPNNKQLPENYFFRHYYPTRDRLKQNRYQLPLQQEDARQNTLVMTSRDYFGL